MRRRALLVLLGASVSPSLGGCLGGMTTSGSARNSSATERAGTPTVDRSEPPTDDCETATQPDPTPPGTDATTAVAPISYPSPPDSPTDPDAVTDYVQAFERAYRRNVLVQQEREDLVRFTFALQETRTYDVPVEAAVVRVQYQYSWTVEEDGRMSIADSPNIFATYYVDRSVVLRAVDSGIRDDPDALDPDPWQSGHPVACLG